MEWKRPEDVAPFPHTWFRFSVRDKDGRSHKLRIQDMTSDQYDEVWNMFEKDFYGNFGLEIYRAVNYSADKESLQFSRKRLFDFVARQNVSVVAILEDEDAQPSIVGSFILSISSRSDPTFPDNPKAIAAQTVRKMARPNFEFVSNFLYDDLGAKYILFENGLVVKPEYRRLGIATELIRTMERIADIFRIPAAVVTFGDIASQLLSRKLDFTLLKEVKLTEYVDENGKIVFPTSNTKVIQFGYLLYSAMSEMRKK